KVRSRELKPRASKPRGLVLPAVRIDSDATLAKYFMKHQLSWIQAEEAIHAQNKQAYALAEKSVRIGWTYADGFKNVRKRLRFRKRDYLFATKDYPSAIEFMRSVTASLSCSISPAPSSLTEKIILPCPAWIPTANPPVSPMKSRSG